jgi:uncharacterized protein
LKFVWFDHLYFIVIAIVVPILSIYAAKTISADEEEGAEVSLGPKNDIYFKNGLLLWIGALLVTASWKVNGRDYLQLGLQAPVINKIVLLNVILLIVIYIGDTVYNIFEYKKSEVLDPKMSAILPVNWKEYLQFSFLAISAGVCEEVIYRGFLTNYLTFSLPYDGLNIPLAILIPACIFAVSHIYQGWFNVVKIFSISILFGNIFVYSKSLLIVIIIHILVDLFSGLVLVIIKKSDNG